MAGKNRIVVDYGDYEGLVLLAAIHTSTGVEMSRDDLEKVGVFDVVKKYDGVKDYSTLKELNIDNEEGFVIRFKNSFRMKIKFSEYVRLHKILTNTSNRDIWEYLKEGKPLDDIIDRVPDEMYNWVKETVAYFENGFKKIMDKVSADYLDIVSILPYNYTEKEYAMEAFKKEYPHLLFTYRKNPDRINEHIWKLLYPEYQKPFADKKNEI